MITNGIKLSFAKKKIQELLKDSEQEEINIPIKSVSVIADLKNIKAFKTIAQLKHVGSPGTELEFAL